jgi:hypothetical protein
MPKMGKYCKAYPITKLREFDKWSEQSENMRKEKRFEDGKEVEVQRQLTDADHLYLQEDYTVTDGIFIGENTIFADVTPEWIAFCKDALNFEIPVYETAGAPAAAAQA